MTHAVQDFAIHAGDDLVITVTVTEDGTANGTPVDLSGAEAITFAAAPWVELGETAARAVTKTLGAGIAITDAAAGKFAITLAPADTAALGGRYTHQARVTDALGKRSTVMTGILEVEASILDADE